MPHSLTRTLILTNHPTTQPPNHPTTLILTPTPTLSCLFLYHPFFKLTNPATACCQVDGHIQKIKSTKIKLQQALKLPKDMQVCAVNCVCACMYGWMCV